jgi:hypothetical protein
MMLQKYRNESFLVLIGLIQKLITEPVLQIVEILRIPVDLRFRLGKERFHSAFPENSGCRGESRRSWSPRAAV